MTNSAAAAQSKTIAKFLDASATLPNEDPEKMFALEWGSNEGCYLTLGAYVYRCHIEGAEAMALFQAAVALYLSQG